MALPEMDICLNVTTEPAVGKSRRIIQKKKEFFKTQAHGSAVKLVGKESENVTSKIQPQNVLGRQNVGAKKRIRQKSLAAIVARNLKGSGDLNQSGTMKDIVKVKSNRTKSAPTSFSYESSKMLSESASQESSRNAFDSRVDGDDGNISERPVVSFSKPVKGKFVKPIVIKKRSNVEAEGRKSLSDIFSKNSNRNDTETNLSSSNVDSVDRKDSPSSDKLKSKYSKEQAQLTRTKKLHFNKKDSRENGNKIGSDVDAKKFVERNRKPELEARSGGKISSLFGNNPEVPHIGQRFVKPVNEIVFTGTKFNDLNIHPFMVSNLEQTMQITEMTIVQQKAIPEILLGKDVLIRSQTGSGKTLAYALPIVESLHKIRPKLARDSGVKALIVVPTRELALQTYECFLKLIKSFIWIVPGYLVGGEKRKAEKARLRRGCTILIATPGRLLDHIKHTEALLLNDVRCLVLDEADRMLDMGYEKDISEIVTALKEQKDNVGFGRKSVSNLKSNDSQYNPLEILRQNVKKVFTDEESSLEKEDKKNLEKTNESNSNTQKKTRSSRVSSNSKDHDIKSIEEKQESNSNSNDSEDETSVNSNEAYIQKEYHSGTDSDTEKETQDFPIKSKKDKQKVAVAKSTDKESRDTKNSEKQQTPPQPRCQPYDDAKSIDSSSDSSRRQTILLSATLTQAVEKLAGLTTANPVFIDAAQENLQITGGNLNEVNDDLIVPQSVVQTYIVTPAKLRMVTLSAYIIGRCRSAGQHKLLVFMATQDMVDYHTEILSSVLTKPFDEDDEDSDALVDVEFFKLHGNMAQRERTEIFKSFRLAKSGVLLCTDVAARGLDMPKVNHVVQYTGPLSARDYVHRIGRTARAGTSGTATIFLTPSEIEFVRSLESRRIRIKQEDMDDVLAKLLGPTSKYSSVEMAATALQNEFETSIIDNGDLHGKACKAYVSWVRFYTSYPRDMRAIFNRKELHLGHYAKSFGLRDPPQRIGGIGKTLRDDSERTRTQHDNRLSNDRQSTLSRKRQDGGRGHDRAVGLLKKVRMLNTSEYGSGLEPMKKSRKL